MSWLQVKKKAKHNKNPKPKMKAKPPKQKKKQNSAADVSHNKNEIYKPESCLNFILWKIWVSHYIGEC